MSTDAADADDSNDTAEDPVRIVPLSNLELTAGLQGELTVGETAVWALELRNEGEQRALIEKSIAEYRLAETGWAGYLAQDPTALDAYESRFWLADAMYWPVVLTVTLPWLLSKFAGAIQGAVTKQGTLMLEKK